MIKINRLIFLILVLILLTKIWLASMGVVFSASEQDRDFLPKFYILQNAILYYGNPNTLNEVMSFGSNFPSRLGIYQLKDIKEDEDKLKILEPVSDEIWIGGEAKGKIEESEIKESARQTGVFYPYVKHKPDSLIYPFVLLKEKYQEWRLRKKPEELLVKKLYFASKRVNEITLWNLEGKNLEETITKYKKKMEEAIGLIKDQDQGEEVLYYIEDHKTKLKNKIQDEIWQDLEDKLKTFYQNPRPNTLEYILKTPIGGDYQVFIKDKSKEVETKVENLRVGENTLTLDLPASENLIGNNWQKTEDKKADISYQSITNWQGSNFYSITGDYLIEEEKLSLDEDIIQKIINPQVEEAKIGVIVMEEREVLNESGNTEVKPLVLVNEQLKYEIGKWKTFKFLVEANLSAKGAKIYLYKETERLDKAIIKNVAVKKIVKPVVMAKQELINQKHDLGLPRVTFVKVNPIKYRLLVEGVDKPYILVFLESFHKGWKAYISDQQSVISDQYGGIVASYFNGGIKEGTHKNIFLDKNTFETWFKKSIPEGRHLAANGYANSWYITPEDSNGKENYEVIIEFWPQRVFYVGLFLSGLTLFSCLFYLGYRFKKDGEKIKNEKN